MPPSLMVVVTFALIFLYSFFLLAQVCIARSRSSRLRVLSRRRYFCAKYARLILSRADNYVMTAQICALFSALAAGFCAELLIEKLALTLQANGAAGFGLLGRISITLTVAGALVIVGTAFMQAARGVGFARPARTLCTISLPLIVCARVCVPLVWIIRNSAGRIFKLIGLALPIERELAVSAEEINEIVEFSTKAGEIEEDEREMIQHVFTFSDTIVREVMTPRKDIISVSAATNLEQLKDVLEKEKLSRILVTGDTLDDVKGVVHVKDLLPLIGAPSPGFKLSEFIRPVIFSPSSQKIDELLKLLRQQAVHFAVVLDEHGAVDGVVTMEDLIEEIVGEIFDEYDSPQEEQEVLEKTAGELLVDGSALIDDLNAAYDLHLERGEYDTVAGLLLHVLGRLPSVGAVGEHGDYLLKAEEIESNRVTKVRISRRVRRAKKVRSTQDGKKENKVQLAGSKIKQSQAAALNPSGTAAQPISTGIPNRG